MPLTFDADTALADAQSAWMEIAPRLGAVPTGYTAHMVQARLNEKAKRIVVRLDAPDQPSFILKQNLDGVHKNHFQNALLAHRRAVTLFERQKGLNVPALRHVDERRQLMLLDFAPGHTAHNALGLAVTTDDRASILRTCGAWLGHLHRSTFVRENQISPKAMIKFVEGQKERVGKGVLKVPEPTLFTAIAAKTLETAAAARGKTTTLSATHGDMNLRNLILGPEGVFGLDFGAVHNAPIGHDLARFFVNLANFHFPDNAAPNDPTWLAVDHKSFFEGYGLEFQHDPSFHYLMRTQLLKEWAGIPKDPANRNALHKRRWEGTKRLVEMLF